MQNIAGLVAAPSFPPTVDSTDICQIPTRFALLNDLSNGRQRSSRARGDQSRRLTTQQRLAGLLQLHQGAPPLSSLAAFN